MLPYDRVAVLIPCRNEELTIAKVIADHKQALPGATVYVFDNLSTDRSADIAAQAGAQVISSPRPGKGHVIRHMFEVVEADQYLIVDGDDTYPAASSKALIATLKDRAGTIHMVIGARHLAAPGAFRRFHRLGNDLFSQLISILFQIRVTDVLSGQRALDRDFVKIVPLRSSGFEIEAELTLRAATMQIGIQEIPIEYRSRPAGSYSKLRTLSDGLLILRTILRIFMEKQAGR